MKVFCTLIWTVIVAIVVERCRAKFLLVEMDDAAGKGKPCFLIQIQYQSEKTYCYCEIKFLFKSISHQIHFRKSGRSCNAKKYERRPYQKYY